MKVAQQLNTEIVLSRMDELGMKRADLADALGVNLSTLWRYLSGRTNVGPMATMALAQVLNLSVEDLIGKPPVLCSRCKSAVLRKTG